VPAVIVAVIAGVVVFDDAGRSNAEKVGVIMVGVVYAVATVKVNVADV